MRRVCTFAHKAAMSHVRLATGLYTTDASLHRTLTWFADHQVLFNRKETSMKSKALVCALAAAALGFGSLSYAQGRDGSDRRGHAPRAEQHEHHRDWRHGHDRRDWRQDRRDWDHGRYYGPRSRVFYRGAVLPMEYRSHPYYVYDWRARHLPAPYSGHQWVRVGSDYALIALASGVIADLIVNH
jgi:Ni/Co efflux regulator RcnB